MRTASRMAVPFSFRPSSPCHVTPDSKGGREVPAHRAETRRNHGKRVRVPNSLNFQTFVDVILDGRAHGIVDGHIPAFGTDDVIAIGGDGFFRQGRQLLIGDQAEKVQVFQAKGDFLTGKSQYVSHGESPVSVYLGGLFDGTKLETVGGARPVKSLRPCPRREPTALVDSIQLVK